MNWRLWFGGIVITLAGLKVYGAQAVRRAKAKSPPAGRFVTVEGIRLHYLMKGAGRPVVFLHGSGLVLQDFTLSIFDQTAEAYQAITFDRPGYGYSQRPTDEPLSLALNARLIHAALSRLGIERPILVGNSTGGSVALRYALDYPDELAGLVLLAPSAYARGLSTPPIFSILNVPLLGPLFLHTLATPLWQMMTPLFGRGLFAPSSPPAGYAATMATFTVRPDQFRTWADELRHLPADLREQSPRYHQIDVPVVTMAGEADQIDRPEEQAKRLHQALPRSELMMLAETGHMVHHRQPQVVLMVIREIESYERSIRGRSFV